MTDIKAIRGRHHRVCTFCGGSPDDPHQAEWRDFYTCSCRDALCPQQLLDAAEARLAEERARIVAGVKGLRYEHPPTGETAEVDPHIIAAVLRIIEGETP